MTEIRPLSPFEDFADLIDNNEENERLRKENEILKQNFMKMTQIIRKYNQQISRKDRLILKLQQKYSFKQIEPSKDCLNSFGKSYYNLNSQQNSPNDQSFKYKTDHKVFNALEECLSEPLIRSEDSHSTIDQILEIFTTLINKMVLEFRTQLFKLNKTVEDKRRLIEKSLQVGYDSNFLDSQIPNDISSDEQTGSRLNELNNNYLELKESYQKLLNQSNSFKSYVSLSLNDFYICGQQNLI